MTSLTKTMVSAAAVPTFLSCLLLTLPAVGEIFSAVSHMENLVDAELKLSQSLGRYIEVEEARLNRIRTLGRLLSNVSSQANADIRRYLGHPVNAYRLLRRFISDWQEVENLVVQPATSEDFITQLTLLKRVFPTHEDLSGAATALMRLQSTYRLEASAIVDGRIPGDQKERMSVSDCYYLGKIAYEDKDYKFAREWMDEALKRWEDNEDKDITLVGVYDYLAFAEFKMGNLKRASRLTKEILSLEPDHPRAHSNLAYYKSIISKEETKRGDDGSPAVQTKQKESPEEEDDYEIVDPRTLPWRIERRRYEKLCREPFPVSTYRSKHFKCFYTTGNRHPRLILKPIAVEVVFYRPTILVYRNILSDIEINRLKELGGPKLNRATAYDSSQQKFAPADYRISKSAWLSSTDDATGIVERIDNRIEAVTGLSMKTAEQLQVVNYGIGGQYEPHYDHAGEGEDPFKDESAGNRIATVLFYLSDLEAGGATVFTGAGARILPSKGDASFWYNLSPAGKGDYMTRHAGCPVLSGLKWVCNKWIHEREQEFRKPCKLNEKADWNIHSPELNK